jgi:hypothetical protein
MAARDSTAKRPSLEKRAFYTISELARVGNVPTYKLRRLLLRHGVDLVRSGRVYYVMLLEIERKIPPLWANLQAATIPPPKTPRTPETPGATGTREP